MIIMMMVRPGLMSWGDRPSEVDFSRWLPIFVEGLRECQEPYRFLSIMGSFDLIEEAGLAPGRLVELSSDLVPPIKKALDTRNPAIVAVCVELMRIVVQTDPGVASVW